MNQVISSVQRFLTSEEGPTAVEYAVLMGLIVVAIVGIVGKLATSISGTFNTVSSTLGSSCPVSGNRPRYPRPANSAFRTASWDLRAVAGELNCRLCNRDSTILDKRRRPDRRRVRGVGRPDRRRNRRSRLRTRQSISGTFSTVSSTLASS